VKTCFMLTLWFALVTIPAMADTVYDNGPINGTTDAWTINFGFIVSDTFDVGGSGATVNGLQFGAWLFPGDVLLNAEVSITDAEFGGTTFLDEVVNFTQSGCTGNQYGFNVCTESGNFTDTNLGPGTYWLNLQNANVNTGDPVYWDENSGPASASENSVGTIPSEAFTILGASTSTTTGCDLRAGCAVSEVSVPEPGTVMLLGAGILGVARKLRGH